MNFKCFETLVLIQIGIFLQIWSYIQFFLNKKINNNSNSSLEVNIYVAITTISKLFSRQAFNCTPVGRASDSMTSEAIYFSWFGLELFCLLLGPPGFNCWFSSAPVFQWCCSTPQGSPGVGRNTFLSSPHLCFIIAFICDLFVSRDDPLMS